VQKLCHGLAAGEPASYPVKTRKLKRSAQALSLLWAQQPDGSVWLEKRPVPGIWGGLYCLPVFESDDALRAHLPTPLHARLEPLPRFVHVLTHKDLHLSPWIAGFRAGQAMPKALQPALGTGAWFGPAAWPALGLPAPIRKLLAQDASA
jgi:A/G-specific adenine glycosylase